MLLKSCFICQYYCNSATSCQGNESIHGAVPAVLAEHGYHGQGDRREAGDNGAASPPHHRDGVEGDVDAKLERGMTERGARQGFLYPTTV